MDDSHNAKQQEDRAFLRERFLRTLLGIAGSQVTFDLQERTSVRATFGVSDVDVLRFHVTDLETPIGVQAQALLRCSDVIAFSCPVSSAQDDNDDSGQPGRDAS